jgi:hypothetical protein
MQEYETVYVALYDEGVDVWRPVLVERVGTDLLRLNGPVPPSECWQFAPGEIVRCEYRELLGGLFLVAVESVSG